MNSNVYRIAIMLQQHGDDLKKAAYNLWSNALHYGIDESTLSNLQQIIYGQLKVNDSSYNRHCFQTLTSLINEVNDLVECRNQHDQAQYSGEETFPDSMGMKRSVSTMSTEDDGSLISSLDDSLDVNWDRNSLTPEQLKSSLLTDCTDIDCQSQLDNAATLIAHSGTDTQTSQDHDVEAQTSQPVSLPKQAVIVSETNVLNVDHSSPVSNNVHDHAQNVLPYTLVMNGTQNVWSSRTRNIRIAQKNSTQTPSSTRVAGQQNNDQNSSTTFEDAKKEREQIIILVCGVSAAAVVFLGIFLYGSNFTVFGSSFFGSSKSEEDALCQSLATLLNDVRLNADDCKNLIQENMNDELNGNKYGTMLTNEQICDVINEFVYDLVQSERLNETIADHFKDNYLDNNMTQYDGYFTPDCVIDLLFMFMIENDFEQYRKIMTVSEIWARSVHANNVDGDIQEFDYSAV